MSFIIMKNYNKNNNFCNVNTTPRKLFSLDLQKPKKRERAQIEGRGDVRRERNYILFKSMEA